MNTSTSTTVTGAMLGSPVGCVVAWIAETAMTIDIPGPIEGSIVVICTAAVALFYPANPR